MHLHLWSLVGRVHDRALQLVHVGDRPRFRSHIDHWCQDRKHLRRDQDGCRGPAGAICHDGVFGWQIPDAKVDCSTWSWTPPISAFVTASRLKASSRQVGDTVVFGRDDDDVVGRHRDGLLPEATEELLARIPVYCDVELPTLSGGVFLSADRAIDLQPPQDLDDGWRTFGDTADGFRPRRRVHERIQVVGADLDRVLHVVRTRKRHADALVVVQNTIR